MTRHSEEISSQSDQTMEAAVSKLPPETLSQIFSHLICQRNLPEEWLSTFQDRVHILQVCAAWRRAALSYKHLWTYIPAFSVGWSRMALQLSDILPIDVVIAGGAGKSPLWFTLKNECTDILLPEMARLRTLIFRVNKRKPITNYHNFLEILRAVSEQETPLLEIVDASGFTGDNEVSTSFRRIFATSRPHMLHMKLSRCSRIRVAEVRFQSLTELYLEDCKLYDLPTDLLHCLSSLPSLTSLSIVRMSYERHVRISAPQHISRRSVILPQLAKLHIKDELAFISCILPYLHFSPRTEVQLRIDTPKTTGQYTGINALSQPNSIVQFFVSHYEPLIIDGAFFRSIHMHHRYDGVRGGRGLYLAITAAELIDDTGDLLTSDSHYSKGLDNLVPSSPLLKIAVVVGHSPYGGLASGDSFMQLFLLLFDSVLVLKRACVFEVHIPPSLRSDWQKSWAKLLRFLEHVEVVQITHDSWLPFSSAIFAHDLNRAGECPFFPSLRELRISKLESELGEALEHFRLDKSRSNSVCKAIQTLASWTSFQLIRIDPSVHECYEPSFLETLGNTVKVEQGESFIHPR